jgi:predicted nucleic acid-binding protein
LEEAFAKTLEEDFENRVLPFDQAAAQAAGRIAAERRRAGRTFEIRDIQIASVVSCARRPSRLATSRAAGCLPWL